MKALFVLITFCLFFIGCDYGYDYNYEITNSTNEVVTVRTVKNNNWPFRIMDSVFQIKPNETKVIINEDGGLCGRNFIPLSEYNMEDTIPPSYIKLDIYVGDDLASGSLRLFKYWNYKAEKCRGIYTLRITEDLLAE